MLTLSKNECIKKIKRRECFSASVESGAFSIKIEEYSPILCAAIHNGHTLRSELTKNFLLTDKERLYEEDPFTQDLVSSFPIVLAGNDSRFEYDLNRAKTLSTYFKTAWDKTVWKRPLTSTQRSKSHAKHQAFYDVLEALIAVVEEDFKSAIIYDIHSYNYKRIAKETPTFNVGTSQIDNERWGNVVNHFVRQLNKIELPNIDTRAAIDEVFHGRGYLITHINSHFDNALVIPVEVKKVFMDEVSGQQYPLVLEELKSGIKQAISQSSAYFMRRYGKKKHYSKAELLSSSLHQSVLKLDKQLYALCKDIETLHFINPINISSERKRFMKMRSDYIPDFRYRQLNIDPYEFRESLYKLPITYIDDADIQQLYRHIVDNLATKIDLLTTIGSEEFVYNSLKYYGEPSSKDIANAQFLLHAPAIGEENEVNFVNANEAVKYFKERAVEWGLKCKIETSSKLVAKAMVNSTKSQLLVNKDARFSRIELEAFAYHELGIHMMTTINAKNQPLKVFSLGLVGNTHTQEGLAIFSEYCSGNLTLGRLKILAMRVIAVNLMLAQNNFQKTYQTLITDYDLEKAQAFTLTTRVYRGGGFTKDYLYLRGFTDILSLYHNKQPMDNLLVGKTGLLDLATINEMVSRGLLSEPVSLFELKPTKQSPIIDYLISGIR